MIKIFCHASEAGIAHQISAIRKYLNPSEYSFSIQASDGAREILESTGSLLNSDICICGFDSIKINRSGLFMNEVRKLNLKSIGILDTWKGIDRFFFEDGNHRQLTDVILVFDEFSKEYLNFNGIPEDKLLLSHDFFLHELLTEHELGKKLCDDGKSRLNKMNLDITKKNLVFFSEPVLNDKGKRISLIDLETNHKGMNVGDLIQELYSQEYNLFIRQHPVEKKIKGNWNYLDNFSLRDIFLLSDSVSGLSSTPIYYASQLGIEVINVENHLKNWKSENSQIPISIWENINQFYKGKKIQKTHFRKDSLEQLIKQML